MIGKLYETLDNKLMKGVNTAVHAYNWTTGGTKAELANGLLTVAPVLESAGYSLAFFPLNLFSISLALYHSHVFQKMNQEMEQREVRALEQGMLSMQVEEYKGRCEKQGLTWGMLSGCWAGSSALNSYSSNNKVGATCAASTAVGTGMRGLSYYVMRADNLPPRKNCVKRGLEKLMAKYEAATAKPAFAPVPVSVPVAGRINV